jgi:HK97 gp10 family phage protein
VGETIRGLEAYLRRLASVPPAVKDAVKAQLAQNADDLVGALKRSAPVAKDERPAGQLRDSIRWYPHPQRELSVRVIADAKDEHGHGYALHVEHGTSDAKASPFFWPIYRAYRKAMRRKLSAAARKAIKEL